MPVSPNDENHPSDHLKANLDRLEQLLVQLSTAIERAGAIAHRLEKLTTTAQQTRVDAPGIAKDKEASSTGSGDGRNTSIRNMFASLKVQLIFSFTVAAIALLAVFALFYGR
ncbi:hypothetical protein [Nonomuraea fuscirosea]|uniref:hypothetical protein n=1 Tax=Nonomuraea fuscirosea TaxID=1291556 RepID=UPI003403959B